MTKYYRHSLNGGVYLFSAALKSQVSFISHPCHLLSLMSFPLHLLKSLVKFDSDLKGIALILDRHRDDSCSRLRDLCH